MNSFQILNANGQALTMKELDKEAAEFWGKEIHPKHYANPFPDKVADEGASFAERVKIDRDNALNNAQNWFDIIGRAIADQENYTTGWQNVAHTLVVRHLGECLINLRKDTPIKLAEFVGDGDIHLEESCEIKLFATLDYFKPFINLINHWMVKGYTPIKVEE